VKDSEITYDCVDWVSIDPPGAADPDQTRAAGTKAAATSAMPASPMPGFARLEIIAAAPSATTTR